METNFQKFLIELFIEILGAWNRKLNTNICFVQFSSVGSSYSKFETFCLIADDLKQNSPSAPSIEGLTLST